MVLALVLFLWTPSHFWSLAIAFRDDYAQAGVPMLPVVKGSAFAAKAILANTVLLVAASLLPAVFHTGWIYLAAAVAGGGIFLWYNLALVADPNRRTAMNCFHASLLQLSLVLAGAMLDRAFLG